METSVPSVTCVTTSPATAAAIKLRTAARKLPRWWQAWLRLARRLSVAMQWQPSSMRAVCVRSGMLPASGLASCFRIGARDECIEVGISGRGLRSRSARGQRAMIAARLADHAGNGFATWPTAGLRCARMADHTSRQGTARLRASGGLARQQHAKRTHASTAIAGHAAAGREVHEDGVKCWRI